MGPGLAQVTRSQRQVLSPTTAWQMVTLASDAASFRVATERFYVQTANLTDGAAEKK